MGNSAEIRIVCKDNRLSYNFSGDISFCLCLCTYFPFLKRAYSSERCFTSGLGESKYFPFALSDNGLDCLPAKFRIRKYWYIGKIDNILSRCFKL